MKTEDLTISVDGYDLAARLFLPDGPAKIACVLHGATGVQRDYYAAFAVWVAEEKGAACLIYSYRDAGLSPKRQRSSATDMKDWGIADQNAALNSPIGRFPGAEIRVIGHSLGGFMTMFHDRADRVARLNAICSGPAYWPRTPFPQMLGAFAFWYLIGPIATLIAGYLPEKAGGIGAAIPAPAFWQWRRWCTNRDLHMIDWGRSIARPDLTRFTGKLRLVAARDDWVIPPEVVRDLARFYPHADMVETAEMDPETAGRPLGHLAAFRPSASAVWPVIWGS